MSEESSKMTIKAWAEADRPREKLLLKGKQSLSDAELLAIIIGSGNVEDSAVELSKKILSKYCNNLNELGRIGVKEFVDNFKGIGEAKAISIIAALEIGRRRQEADGMKKEKITSSKDIANIFQPLLSDLLHEEFWVLFLNRSNKILSRDNISSGGVAGTVVDTKLIFKKALEHTACGIVLCHNHPSGNLQPSDADIKLTKKIKEAGTFMEINVLDHIIVAGTGYYSFADEGII